MATTTSQINEIKEDLSDAYTALGNKGATLPASNARGTSNLASTVATIPAVSPVNKAFNVSNGVVSRFQVIIDSNSFAGITQIEREGLRRAYMGDSVGQSPVVNGTLVFPDLVSIGQLGLYEAFHYAYVSSISFPKLTTIGDSGLAHSFCECAAATISFPELTTVGNSGMQYAFYNNKQVTTISFPKLSSIELNALGTSNSSTYAFRNCTAITAIHFPEDMQSTVESMLGYSSKWGATNATIYFDL